jgi:hypothetical protein
LIRQEFDALIGASWEGSSPPPSPAPSAPSHAIPPEAESTEGRSQQRNISGIETPSGEPRPPPE